MDNYEWEVNELLAVKKMRNKLFYYANWLGHDEDLEWYLVSDFKYTLYKLKAFYLCYPELLNPPYKLND